MEKEIRLQVRGINCCIVNCNNAVFAASAVATRNDLQHAFDSTGVVVRLFQIPHHYANIITMHVVYGELQSRQFNNDG